ncbi:GAF domain-containing protein [Natrinema sp. 1APR25-10V2]|uniref:PAS domain S-box protein n=1 Tax=Natrinema sp. 1APR25-10V2 TaxID=2951081 RepID=UPI0028767A08|nr:GAF domain-containing protein [Natrinema sp. 1APR25-10V2]MDS0474663.1 PAS domain S-box protein [Natrinema sp. 1APR25-10V2]
MGIDEAHTTEQLRALAETTPDALITIDTESQIQFVNPAIEDILGYSPDDLIGKSLTSLMAEELGERHLDAVDRYLTTGDRRLDWDYVELPGQHKDGYEVPLGITFSEFTTDGDRFFTGILRDISERKQLEAERELLHTAREGVIEAESFSDGLTNALRLLGESMNWVYGEAWVPNEDTDQITWEAAWEADTDDLKDFREVSTETTFEKGKGLVGRVWETGEYEWIPDVSTVEESAFKRTDIARESDLKAAAGVPITSGETVVAVLVFLMAEERPVDERMVEVTRTVAANLGLLMARKQAEIALRDERNLLSNILKTTPTGIVVIDPDGEFTYLNDRAEEILRLHPDEYETHPSFEDVPYRTLDEDGEPLPEDERPYQYVLRTGEGIRRNVQIEFPNGDRRWLSVHGTPLHNESNDVTNTVFAFEDITELKRRTGQLERLNVLGQDLTDAESFDEACDQALTAAHDILDLSITTIERYNAETGRLEPCARTPRVKELVGDDPLFKSDRDLPWEAFVQNEAHAYSDLEQETDLEADETPLSSAIIIPIDSHGVLISGSPEPNDFSEQSVTLAEILAGNTESAFDRLVREATLREQKSELETKNDQLERVQRVNQEIRDITEALMGADSSTEIKQLICERLADSDPYRFVWFADQDLATDEIVPVASAGVEEGYLDAVTVTADTSESGQGPAGRAIRRQEPQIQNNLQADPPFEPWRQEAMQRGYRASIAVPVVYQGTLYGLLNLYANEPGVFTEMEQAVLTELGEMIGYALNAMERYKALVSKDSVELEFVIRDFSDPILNFLGDEEAEFRLENIGKRKDGTVRVFAAFEQVSLEAIQSFVGQHAGVDDLTLIRERDGETIVELSLAADSFIVRLLDRGAVPTSIRGTPNEGRVTIRVSKSASVREFVSLFEQQYDDVDLVGRREAPEPVQTKEEFERAYIDRLTERQQEVLKTAYFAGFFEQPKESTARDLAEILDISQPTVSRHIRSSEEKLFSMLFGDRASK